MSRKGAESRSSSEGHELVEVDALGRCVISAAQTLLAQGLDSGEACTLLLHAAVVLSRQSDGLSRAEFLELATELLDEDALEDEVAVTSPGGSA